jgi:hypothetical protein
LAHKASGNQLTRDRFASHEPDKRPDRGLWLVPEFRREVQHPSALNLLDFAFLGAAFASSKCSGRRRRGMENPIFPW